ncbi:MAG: hypothetical protein IKJ43_03890 [Bacilli bacterium]|nr:hypothetical protein [Bacilli bacterium]
MRQSQRIKRNYIIGGLCAVVAIMTVGFAAFSQSLTINSTSEVTSTWDVHIKDNGVSYKNAINATSTLAEKTSNLVATFACNLTTPGTSTISYDVVVENKGSLKAKLDSIELTGGNDAISVVTSPTNDSLSTSPIVLAPNDETTITVTVSYNNINTQPTGDGLRTNIIAKLNFSQTNLSSSSETQPQTIYSFNTERVYFNKKYCLIDDSTNKCNTWYETESDCLNDNQSITNPNCSQIPLESIIGHETNYQNLNKKMFLKHIVNDGEIEESYFCIIYNDNNTPLCLRSGIDESNLSSRPYFDYNDNEVLKVKSAIEESGGNYSKGQYNVSVSLGEYGGFNYSPSGANGGNYFEDSGTRYGCGFESGLSYCFYLS